MRPRDLDIPEIFYRLYSFNDQQPLLEWCNNYLFNQMKCSFSPQRQDVLGDQPAARLRQYLSDQCGKFKLEGLANSGDLVMVYGALTNDVSLSRFVHIWWLSGKRVISFECMSV